MPNDMSDKPLQETKFTRANLETVSVEGVFEGYAALFSRVDLAKDTVVPGAFSESLRRRGARGVKLLYQHDPSQLIGFWEDIREDARGLLVRGRLLLGVARAREVLELMREGVLDGLSIGFKTLKARRDPKTGVRRIDKLDLWEISLVTFPMQPEARVNTVKHGAFTGALPSERQFERWLKREAGLTREQARTVVCSGFKVLAGKLGAAGGAGSDQQLAETIRRAALQLESASKR